MRQLDDINIAIASAAGSVQKLLQTELQQRGANITRCGLLDLSFVIHLEDQASADVILLDISENYDEDVLDLLLERVDVPVLFHDYHCLINGENKDPDQVIEQPLEQLAEKIASQLTMSGDIALAQANKKFTSEKKTEIEEPLQILEKKSKQRLRREDVRDIETAECFQQAETKPGQSLACSGVATASHLNLWVLAASIGGPESVKRFLAKLPARLPVAFVLAQHLGNGFAQLLAQQLNSVSELTVKKAEQGDSLRHGDVLVVPVKNMIAFDSNGIVSILEEPWRGHYKPAINDVISNITQHFNQHTGIIMFSGMGVDGVEASLQFHKQFQGEVWAQDAGSCVVSSMPDSVRKENIVSYSGSPESLAKKMITYYSR